MSGTRTLRAAGLMSGTSADGVDAAVVDITGRRVEVAAFDTFDYPPRVRTRVLALCRSEPVGVREICHLNFVLGEVFASALIELSRRSRIDLAGIDVIGSHGQTICHQPRPRRIAGRAIRSTLQIGEPCVIAERTGVTTVADFRPRDIAAGGEGAPLVPYADYFLFAHTKLTRAVQNIGGIANVTFLPAGGAVEDVTAFDTGPGNMIIDRLAWRATSGRRRMDRNGRIAAAGRVDEALLAELMAHPYFRRRPPKSAGREDFGDEFTDRLYERARRRGLSPPDVVATATAFTARSIAAAYRRFGPKRIDEVLLCGGGAANATLVEMLRGLPGVRALRTTDDLGIGADAKEAVSFAVLAAETIRGAAGNVPGATGADRPVVLGKIVPAGGANLLS